MHPLIGILNNKIIITSIEASRMERSCGDMLSGLECKYYEYEQ